MKALHAIRDHTADRALVVMACGTGKTLVGRRAATDRSAKTMVVTVPTLALAEQTQRSWAEDYPDGLASLIVCSDQSIGGTQVPVTVSPEIISEFLTAESATPRLLVSTYQSAERIAEAYTLRPFPPLDIAVLDEVHHTAGSPDKAAAVVLDDHRIPVAFRLAMTATPVVHRGADGTGEVVSMDREDLYGERIYELGFGAAIEQKLLTDYQVAIVLVSDQDVHASLQDQEPTARHGASRHVSTMAAQVAVARAMKEYDLVSAIAFHSRVEHSERFASGLTEVGATAAGLTITSLHMDGATPAAERGAQLAALADPVPGSRVVLSNVRVLTEGVDVNSVDAVCLIDPKTSERDIIQAVGRALRIHPHHDRPALILLTVYLAPGESPQAVLERSAFRHVWRVLATLRNQDERMDAALTAARRRLGSGEPSETLLPPQIHLLGAEVDRFAEALAVHVLRHTTEDWHEVYGQLERFALDHGHTRVPYTSAAGSLSDWAYRQRSQYNSGGLTPERVGLLEALPGWNWNVFKARRDEARRELERFVAAHGHARVPRGYAAPGTGFRLDSHVVHTRVRRRDGLSTPEEIAYYEALPGWMWQVNDEKTADFFLALDRFVAQHGHSRVPQRCAVALPERTIALGHAVSIKRGQYRKGTLPEWQVEECERRPGWMWDGVAAIWEASFEIVQRWAEQHGHLRLPFDKPVEGVVVYRWMLQQRRLIKQGALQFERLDRLRALPGWHD